MDSIIASVITGFLSLLGVLIATVESNKKFESKMETAQALTDCKLEELTREVRAHNNFAEKIPVIETEIRNIKNDFEKFKK